jgi:hypothetical protein
MRENVFAWHRFLLLSLRRWHHLHVAFHTFIYSHFLFRSSQPHWRQPRRHTSQPTHLSCHSLLERLFPWLPFFETFHIRVLTTRFSIRLCMAFLLHFSLTMIWPVYWPWVFCNKYVIMITFLPLFCLDYGIYVTDNVTFYLYSCNDLPIKNRLKRLCDIYHT